MYTELRKLIGDAGPFSYAFAVCAVAVALCVELFLSKLTSSSPSMTLFALSIAISAWYGGVGPGVLALLSSAVAIDYVALEPGTLLSVSNRGQAALFACYFLGWFGFCVLIEKTYRRLRRDKDLRRIAEKAARHSDRLAQMTTALGQARTPAAVIEAALQEPLHALDADAGAVMLTQNDGATADVVRVVGHRQDAPTLPASVDLTEKGPIRDAVGRGAPVIVESKNAATSEYRGARNVLSLSAYQAIVVVPLVIGSRVVALVQLEFSHARTFTSDDRDYLFAIGPRAAQALDRTWQYESAQRARAEAEALRARADQELEGHQQTEVALRASETRYRTLAARTNRLHGLTAALSEAVSVKAVAQAVVRQGKIAVGATSGDVLLLVDHGAAFETLHSDVSGETDSAGRRVPAESGLCATQVVQTKQPIFIGSFTEWQERYWLSASIAADGGYVSSATLPLLADNAAIGVLAFHFTAPVKFDEEYQALLVSVAQHCAQALDRARLYESAQRARTEAETANRLKDEFVSIVSHDLRTPLNAMLGWTAMLQKGTMDPSITARALRSIHDNATRQAKLIDDLLDFSRIIAGRLALEREEVDLRQLLRNVIESMIPAAAEKRIEMQFSAAPDGIVLGDMRRLEQVFFNLLGNAVKFTEPGGRVDVELEAIDDIVEVRVVDTGIGIDPLFLPHVFDRFRQADSTTSRGHGGVGLGLSIARQLVEAHQGKISVKSPGKDQGATFIVRLPSGLQRPVAAAPALAVPGESVPEPKPLQSIRLDGVHVLVVDDESDSREVMAHALEDCGARVTVAENARDALDILERAEVDVLLADVAMPNEDGYALIRKIRASTAGRVAAIPAAAVTAHAREDERRLALSAGFHLHLAKPFEIAQLTRTVQELVRGSSLIH
jgi:signal transduction histidine kinase/ActR/RegA family two-component response regulator